MIQWVNKSWSYCVFASGMKGSCVDVHSWVFTIANLCVCACLRVYWRGRSGCLCSKAVCLKTVIRTNQSSSEDAEIKHGWKYSLGHLSSYLSVCLSPIHHRSRFSVFSLSDRLLMLMKKPWVSVGTQIKFKGKTRTFWTLVMSGRSDGVKCY